MYLVNHFPPRAKFIRFLAHLRESVKIFSTECVSKGIVSALTAELKYSHGRREDTHESEAVTEVACDGFGGGRKRRERIRFLQIVLRLNS